MLRLLMFIASSSSYFIIFGNMGSHMWAHSLLWTLVTSKFSRGIPWDSNGTFYPRVRVNNASIPGRRTMFVCFDVSRTKKRSASTFRHNRLTRRLHCARGVNAGLRCRTNVNRTSHCEHQPLCFWAQSCRPALNRMCNQCVMDGIDDCLP